MRHLTRLLALTLLAGLFSVARAAAPVAASSVPAPSSSAAGPTTVASLSSAKVVIIVGPTEDATASYKADGDSVYSTAIQYSSNVVKVYSPNATWAAVQAAVADASIVVYLGHGNGWPSPYGNDSNYTTKDGFGLNDPANLSDSRHVYYGEPDVSTLPFAPNAVVLLNHLCYASGNSEPQNAAPTLDVAEQRVDNYGQGFLKAGAAAVIAEGHGSLNGMIRDLFTTHQSLVDMWRTQSDYNGNEFSFQSFRSPSYTAYMDPDSPSGGYYRSFVGSPNVQTDDVTGVNISPTRLAGPDRFSTAAAISAATFSPGVPIAYLTTGYNFPDALAGAAAAGSLHAPILLVAGDTIPAPTAVELARLQPQRIVILGSTGVVSTAVEAAAQGYTSGTVTRLAGTDRYETAAAISAASFNAGVATAYLATGLNFPDALAGAAAAGARGAPILLVTTDTIPPATAGELTRLQPSNIVILGSTGVVSDGVAAAAQAFTTGTVTRIGGLDRYATAAAISAATFDPGVSIAYVATGLNFPDALAGAAAAGANGAPILLVGTTTVPAATAAELDRLKPGRIVVLGGTGVVSEEVRLQVQQYKG